MIMNKIQTLQQYKEEKLKLFKQFYIKLNSQELTHFRSLTTEIAVDNFCRKLFMKL